MAAVPGDFIGPSPTPSFALLSFSIDSLGAAANVELTFSTLAAIFSHRDRQHDTEVCEAFKPAVMRETVVQREAIEETIAVDREVHQDHHQLRIQPIEDKVHEVEKHEQNMLPIERREQRHGKDAEVQRKLEQEVFLSSSPPSLDNSGNVFPGSTI